MNINILEAKISYETKHNNESIFIKILVKDRELYNFCKQDFKRLYFIIEKIYKYKKEILFELIIEHKKIKDIEKQSH
ncbi:plasmid partition family protein (plasmid) [Borreliella finlandensis]|uniref:plasmid partition family protein n=1 Tax=Borreliella finlandensis TaxID=498741 RepID=UPI003AF138A5